MLTKTAPIKAHRGQVWGKFRLTRRIGSHLTQGNVVWLATNILTGAVENVRAFMEYGVRRASRVGAHLFISADLEPTLKSWRAMLARCYVPQCGGYRYYGGRGIKVCDPWRPEYYGGWDGKAAQSAFGAFVTYMGMKPAGHELDRIDPDGNYEPGNVRWLPRELNIRRRRRFFRSAS